MRRSLVLLVMLGMTGAALASPPPAGPPACAAHWRMVMQRMEQRQMKRLSVLLGLTPAQRGKVKAILAEEHARLRRRMRKVMEQVRATHRAARHETLEKLSSVLSPEQMSKLKLLMPGRMMIRFRGGPGARVFGPGMR